jgi:glycerol-3-phosphate acyltransferase PlsX
MSRYSIAIDTMGGDNGSEYMMMAVADALKAFADTDYIVTGNEAELKSYMDKYSMDGGRVKIIPAGEAISCHDAPVEAIRKKKDSSLVLALDAVKDGRADACISAGSSGAVLAGGQFIVGRAKGVKRTPLAPLIPTAKGSSLLIDCGANVDAKPEVLVQFAKMGAIYMENIVGVKNPRVAIVNIGTEDEKGNALVKETIPLLRECSDINFIGSIESREIPFGGADVIVCEAFVGNVILKLYEGLSGMLLKEIKGAMMSNLKSKIGGLMLKKSIKTTVKKFKTDDKGGAPLLGLKGLVVKIHGNSKKNEVYSAIIQCRNFIENDVSGKIVSSFEGT